MSKNKPTKEELDKMSDAMLRKPKCDYCPYTPSSFTDYVNHLAKDHPEGGSTKSR